MPRARRNNRFRDFEISVFINCPFDKAYQRLFHSIIFTVAHCGFRARCAQEIDDSGQVRIEKIFEIIEECRFGIHDLSRTQLDRTNRLPRFNMPLELGMFLGAKRCGIGIQRRKICLILDREAHRYQKFISDIAGQDIRAHRRQETQAISLTRDWLRNGSGKSIPGGGEIGRQYQRFKTQLPSLCRKLKLRRSEMTFNDYINIVAEWLKERLQIQ